MVTRGVACGHDPLLLLSVDTYLFTGSHPCGLVLTMAVPGTVIKTSQYRRWPRKLLRAAHVLLPDDLPQTWQDRVGVLFNELGAKTAQD